MTHGLWGTVVLTDWQQINSYLLSINPVCRISYVVKNCMFFFTGYLPVQHWIMYYLTLPYIVLNSSFISWRCALHLVVTTWIMASSSVPKPFIAFLKYSQSASQLQFSPSMKYRASCCVWSIYEARKTQTLDVTLSALFHIFMITNRKTKTKLFTDLRDFDFSQSCRIRQQDPRRRTLPGVALCLKAQR